MANAADEKAVITENLTDIGLDGSSISRCIDMLEKGMYSALERFLLIYRRDLLESLQIKTTEVKRNEKRRTGTHDRMG